MLGSIGDIFGKENLASAVLFVGAAGHRGDPACARLTRRHFAKRAVRWSQRRLGRADARGRRILIEE